MINYTFQDLMAFGAFILALLTFIVFVVSTILHK